MEEKISNTIFIHQQTIHELEKLKDKVRKSISNVRFRIETKHWYGYGIDTRTETGKSILNLSKATIEIVLEEAIRKEKEKIDKLIDMEIERRRTSHDRGRKRGNRGARQDNK